MEDMQRLKLQYVAAMANQEVVQQQLNIDRFLRGRLRLRPWLHSGRRRQLASMISSWLSSEDPGTFKKFFRMPTEMYDTILGRFVIAS
ncbi:hypothetical protein DPMN_087248 [Dreissena polymorpha]|uniref:Uncharacterized protein n=1 Tax=Dreissena polymorpha TaxID=45954 RepID=A0A9D4QWQ1_DREPO|nr:hypothetical protein DPMN_087248 [Dreissena polymorpha]